MQKSILNILSVFLINTFLKVPEILPTVYKILTKNPIIYLRILNSENDPNQVYSHYLL